MCEKVISKRCFVLVNLIIRIETSVPIVYAGIRMYILAIIWLIYSNWCITWLWEKQIQKMMYCARKLKSYYCSVGNYWWISDKISSPVTNYRRISHGPVLISSFRASYIVFSDLFFSHPYNTFITTYFINYR